MHENHDHEADGCTVDELEMAMFEQISRDGQVDVRCSACGDWHTVEPDYDDVCPTCETPLVSPLREAGLI